MSRRLGECYSIKLDLDGQKAGRAYRRRISRREEKRRHPRHFRRRLGHIRIDRPGRCEVWIPVTKKP
ncbi:hypothetical protein ACTHPF_17265 [Paenibacillus sp. SAF-054]|uniref:hypothetical protein n=1 Tax=unclassified Paenibacillus TaxID=185978 RepID=UPI003F802DB8